MNRLINKYITTSLLLIVLGLGACDTTNEYALEDDLLQCFLSQYAAVNIDISKSIDSAGRADLSLIL